MLKLAVGVAAFVILVGCAAVDSRVSRESSAHPSAATSFNEQPVPTATCSAVDDTSTPEAFDRSIRDYVECARRAWSPALEAIGRRAPEPAVFLEAKDAPSACAGMLQEEEAGMFCNDDGSLVFSDDLRAMADDWDLTVPRIIFHEYGHAVQQELGMVLDTPPGDPTRRLELKATCWSAMLLRTLEGLQVTDDVREDLATEVASITDADHGTAESRRRWTLIGFDAVTIGECDTSRAADALVA